MVRSLVVCPRHRRALSLTMSWSMLVSHAANALLDSLVALIASVRYPETSPAHASPRLLPPPAFLAKLAPLLLGARAREPSYRGTLDPVNDRALKMREAVSMAPPAGTGGLGGEMDLDVKV